MPAMTALDRFLRLSEILTGEARLDRTLAGEYLARLQTAYPQEMKDLLLAFGAIANDPYPVFEVKRRIVDDKKFSAMAQEITATWYTSEFLAADGKTAVVGTQAQFNAGLLWKVIKAHPPAHSTQSYGYWTKPPRAN
jgi:hypothetical protein